MGGHDTRTGDGDETRADRLARALRENLRRRKSQARARAAGQAESDPARGRPDPDDDTGAEGN